MWIVISDIPSAPCTVLYGLKKQVSARAENKTSLLLSPFPSVNSGMATEAIQVSQTPAKKIVNLLTSVGSLFVVSLLMGVGQGEILLIQLKNNLDNAQSRILDVLEDQINPDTTGLQQIEKIELVKAKCTTRNLFLEGLESWGKLTTSLITDQDHRT